MSPSLTLSEESIDDLLYAARAPDLDFLKVSLAELSALHQASEVDIVAAAIDAQTGNGMAHYAAANGCVGILTHILSLPSTASTALAFRPNTAQNTPLHYASLNGQLPAAQLLLSHLKQAATPEQVMDYLSAKNSAGHDAAFEAEIAGKEEVVNWLLGEMDGVERAMRGSAAGAAEAGGEAMDEDKDGEGEEEEVIRVSMGVADMDVGEKP